MIDVSMEKEVIQDDSLFCKELVELVDVQDKEYQNTETKETIKENSDEL